MRSLAPPTCWSATRPRAWRSLKSWVTRTSCSCALTAAWHAGRRCSLRYFAPFTPRSMPASSIGPWRSGAVRRWPRATMRKAGSRMQSTRLPECAPGTSGAARSAARSTGRGRSARRYVMSAAELKHLGDVASQGELKQQLVDCIRMLEQADIIDYNGHCSIRVDDDRVLINIGSCQRSRLTVEDICTIDFDGNVIEGKGKPPLEFHLHCGIYRARADVKAVVHAHPKWSTFLTMVGQSYQPVYAQGSLVYPMPVLDSPNSINNRAMADRLAVTLGDRPAAMIDRKSTRLNSS